MKMSSLRIPSFCFALSIMTLPAFAEGKLEFWGTALSGCTLDDLRSGNLTLGGDLATWTTDTPATLAVATTAGGEYQLTIRRGTTWTVAPNGVPATTFMVSPVIVSGPNANAPFSGNADDLARKANLTNAGRDNVEVRLTASSGINPFKAGEYMAEVTVTCATP